ncbi:MAG: hypothetical protein J5I93_26260 [Pirellulaceae bacterium]|nr:hypothetical protein [Pirellulaceae bacterium]
MSAAEVLSLPEWDRALLADMKRLGMSSGGHKGLYQALRDQAGQQQDQSDACQVVYETSLSKSVDTYLSKWNRALQKLARSTERNLEGRYHWAAGSQHYCYPEMLLTKRGKGVVLYLQWAALEAPAGPLLPPDEQWSASLLLRASDSKAAEKHFPDMANGPDKAWTRTTTLGHQTLAFSRKFAEPDSKLDTEDLGLLVAAARWAWQATGESSPELRAALIVERASQVSGQPTLSLSADLIHAWKLASEYSDSADKTVEPTGGLLVDRRTYKLLRHEFHCEPLADFNQYGPAYRLWSNVPLPHWTPDAIGAADHQLDEEINAAYKQLMTEVNRQRDEKISPGLCFLIRTNDDHAACYWDYALRRWAQRNGSADGQLFLDCLEGRQQDLLNPVVTALRYWINLNRKSPDENAIGRLRSLIADWVARFSGADEARQSDYTSLLEALLLGGELHRGQYEEVTSRLIATFKSAAKCFRVENAAHGLTLVVHNLHAADCATRQLVEELAGAECVTLLVTCDAGHVPKFAEEWKGFHDGMSVLPDIANSGEQDEWWRKLTDDDRQLLAIALEIGPDALRSWLRNVWCELVTQLADSTGPAVTKRHLRRRFEVACANLLRLGVLRVTGRLADVACPAHTYREISFASQWHWRKAADLIPPSTDLRSPVKGIFATVLQRRLNAHSQSLDSVRRKILVCNCLRGQPVDKLPPGLLPHLVQLWMIVAGRAYEAGFTDVAAERIKEARRLLLDGEAANVPGCTPQLWAEVVTFCLALPGGAFASDQALPREAEELLEASQQTQPLAGKPIDLFALNRSYWSFLNRWAPKLIIAEEFAEKLEARLPVSETCQSPELRLEVQHVLAVSLFGAGKLKDLVQVAEKGREICRRQETANVRFDGSPKFGSHCGGGCCKALLGIGLSIVDDNYAKGQKLMQDAIAWTTKVKDPASQTIAHAYQGLLSLFFEEYEQAMEDVGRAFGIKRTRSGQRWLLMSRLVWTCAAVGQSWKEPLHIRASRGLQEASDPSLGVPGETSNIAAEQPLVERLYPTITELIELWEDGGRDLLTIWRTFQGVAACALGRSDGLRLIEGAIEQARQRGELLFLPAALRWLALMRMEQGDREGAENDLRIAIEEARSLQARLFIRQAEVQLQSLVAP